MAELTMHAGQKTVFQTKRRFKVVVAGRRWGKTQLSKISIVRRCGKPKQLIWYVAPTYRMARGILWDELLDAIPKAWVARVNETLMVIRLHNGTRIELKGADKPDTLRGVGLHHLIIDEAQDIKEDTWIKVLRPTLASTQGDALIIGTPKSFNWLYEHWLLGQREDVYTDKTGKRRRNVWKSWQFPTITSPFIPDEEVEAARADMDEKSFRQEFEASFETMAGRVYHAFDRNVHLGDLSFNPRLDIWVGMDFNIDPMSAVIMQPQDNGEVHIIDEIILPSSNTDEMAQELARRYHRQLKRMVLYPDPAGTQRGHARGESDIDILRDAGFKRIKFKRKHPPVADRVNAVNRMLRAADGSVKMRVDRKCRHTIAALEQTIYKEGSRDIDKSGGLEHPADGLGYCIDWEYPIRKIVIQGLSI